MGYFFPQLRDYLKQCKVEREGNISFVVRGACAVRVSLITGYVTSLLAGDGQSLVAFLKTAVTSDQVLKLILFPS